MSDLNKSIRSTEHKVAVDVLNTIISNANEYMDTIAIEQNEKDLASKIGAGKKVNKADVEKLLPTSGLFSTSDGNLDLLEVLFLKSIFPENKINADNVKIIADVIKGVAEAKKSIEKYLLEYFLVPLESVWAADQYQDSKFNTLSDAAKKVFEIIYKDFLSTSEATAAIDFTLGNFEQKEIKIDAFNLIIVRCLEFGVDNKTIKQLIDKGIALVESNKELLSDLHSHVTFAFYQKVNSMFVELNRSAKDDAEYSEIADNSVKANSELDEAVKLIEEKGRIIGLKFDDDIEEYIKLAKERAEAFINTVSGVISSGADKNEASVNTTKTEKAEAEKATEKAKAEAQKAEAEKATEKANEISEKFINNVIDKINTYKAQPDELNFGNVQARNVLKDLSANILNAENTKDYVKNLMKYKSGSLGADAFKPVGEYQSVVKNALYTCANYLKSGKHMNNCFSRLKSDTLIKAVKQEAKSNACYFKLSESGNGQYSNLHIKFAEEGYPNYLTEKTANPSNGCIEIKDNDPLELLAIAAELTADN